MATKPQIATILIRVLEACSELRKQGKEPKALYIGSEQLAELKSGSIFTPHKHNPNHINGTELPSGTMPIFRVMADDHFNVVAEEPNVNT